jgi:hypothetical protein
LERVVTPGFLPRALVPLLDLVHLGVERPPDLTGHVLPGLR